MIKYSNIDVTGSISLTGSLIVRGTSNITASLAINSATSVSASHALRSVSGSHALRSVSGSHALRANTAGSATTATTATSASFATTAATATQVRTTSGTTDTTTWLPLVGNNTTGGQSLVLDSELSYNSVTHVLNTSASYALNTPAVYGRAVMTTGTTVSVLNGATQTVMEFTIPSAGIWEVNYNVRTRTTAVNTYASIFLTDTSNTQIANTSTLLTAYIQGASGQRQATNGAGASLDVFVNNVPLGISDLQLNTRGMDFLTTTGATTYRIRMTSVGGTTQALSDNNGQVVVWYRKIG